MFGTCAGSYPSPTIRALIICTVLIMEMAISGAAYYSQYAVTESYDDDFEATDLVWWRELAVGGICSFAGLTLGAAITILHSKIAIIGWILSGLSIAISSSIVVYMSFVFVKLWSMIWMFGWLCAAIIDIGVGHLAIMFITQTIFKIGPDY